MRKNTALYVTIILVAALLILVIVPGQAQTAYDMSREDITYLYSIDRTVKSNTYEFVKLQLVKSNKYKVKVASTSKIDIMFGDKKCEVEGVREFLVEDVYKIKVYLNNQSKKKAKVKIVVNYLE